MTLEDRWLAFVPRDTIFVRDGRGFDAGVDVVAHTVAPGPSTVAGAVGAAFGREVGEVRGPVLARRDRGRWWPHHPAPRDLVVTATGDVHRIVRGTIDGQTDLPIELDWLEPPESAGRVEPLDGLLPARALERYLAGEWPARFGSGPERVAHPLRPESRVGLAREGRAAREGFLYRSVHQRPDDGWALLAGCVLEPWTSDPRSPVQLGGKGRMVDVEDAGEVAWPAAPTDFPGGRLLLYLATPALWPDGWRPPLRDRATLVAAATGEPQPVATMTPGRGWKASRSLRWAVPAGSVYLLRFPDAAEAATFSRRWHGSAYEQVQERLRTAGYGVVLTGVWE